MARAGVGTGARRALLYPAQVAGDPFVAFQRSASNLGFGNFRNPRPPVDVPNARSQGSWRWSAGPWGSLSATGASWNVQAGSR